MSELRHNSITGQWVILAENRSQRPQEIAIQQCVRSDFQCPFCEGRENLTPGETLAIRSSGTQRDRLGWQVRVVPNKYPVLEAVDSANPQTATGPSTIEMCLPGAGLHEIIIESPRHLTSVTQLNDAELAVVLGVYRERLATLRRENRYTQVSLFKNSGPLGGATLWHLHSQLIATEAKRPVLGIRAATFLEHWQTYSVCPLCSMIDEEQDQGQRIIAESQHFLAFCPAASRFPYEMWIVPRSHVSSFDEIDSKETAELARMFRQLLVKLEAIVKLPAYNYVVQTAPFDTAIVNHYHWHIEILPRITNLAGFELGTGCFINAVYPEKAASALRIA